MSNAADVALAGTFDHDQRYRLFATRLQNNAAFVFKIIADRFTKGAKIQLKGKLGSALLPVFEKRTKENPTGPLLKDFIDVGSEARDSIKLNNPLYQEIPSDIKNFRDVLESVDTA